MYVCLETGVPMYTIAYIANSQPLLQFNTNTQTYKGNYRYHKSAVLFIFNHAAVHTNLLIKNELFCVVRLLLYSPEGRPLTNKHKASKIKEVSTNHNTASKNDQDKRALQTQEWYDRDGMELKIVQCTNTRHD